MSWPSFLVAHAMAGLILLFCWFSGVVSVLAVLFGYTTPWLLLVAAMLLWSAFEGTANLYKWFVRLPERHLSVGDLGFSIKNQLLPYPDVFIIFCRPIIINKRLNFIKRGRDFTVSASIMMRDGREFRLRAGQGPVTWFGPTYGAAESKRLMLKLRSGHERTSAAWAEE